MQHQKKISENKTEITAANTTGCKNAIQLKDNRKTSVIQQKLSENATTQESSVIQRKNNTGLPDNLKSGIENLSGHSMDDVKVHYNSEKPAQLNAHAYAQGTDIHVASGQEKHLAHEAWHVIQQKQGRVKPTLQMKGKMNVNDDKGLEKEADIMGAKALQMKSYGNSPNQPLTKRPLAPSVIQGLFYEYAPGGNIYHYGPVISAIWAPKLNEEGQQEEEKGTGIWLRKTSKEYVAQIVAQDERIRAIHQGFQEAIAAIDINVSSREEVIERLQTTHEVAKKYLSELKSTLSKYAILGVLGVAGTVGAVVIAEHFLSLPGVPWGLKVAIDIAGILYGAYVSIRWLQSTVLPKLTSLLMAAVNTGVWTVSLYHILTEIASGHAFASVHVAALPLAITLEILIRKLDGKIRKMGERNESSHLL